MVSQTTDSRDDDRTVKLAEHLAFSRSFQPLFNEGMAMVDETAAYLDGDGRTDAKSLNSSYKCQLRGPGGERGRTGKIIVELT